MIAGFFFVLGCDSENRDRWNGAPELVAPTSVPDRCTQIGHTRIVTITTDTTNYRADYIITGHMTKSHDIPANYPNRSPST